MDNVTRVGIDLAKKVFHVTAVDATGAVMVRRRFRRAGLQSYLAPLPRGCVVVMEACGSGHHWGRLAMRLGHRCLRVPSLSLPMSSRTGTTSTMRAVSQRRLDVRRYGSWG